jgi:hypothetical protein
MATITPEDLQGGLADLQTIKELATSQELTVTDRLGNTKPTWTGLLQAVQQAVAVVGAIIPLRLEMRGVAAGTGAGYHLVSRAAHYNSCFARMSAALAGADTVVNVLVNGNPVATVTFPDGDSNGFTVFTSPGSGFDIAPYNLITFDVASCGEGDANLSIVFDA